MDLGLIRGPLTNETPSTSWEEGRIYLVTLKKALQWLGKVFCNKNSFH